MEMLNPMNSEVRAMRYFARLVTITRYSTNVKARMSATLKISVIHWAEGADSWLLFESHRIVISFN